MSDVNAILAQIRIGYIIPIRTRHQPQFVPGEVLDIREYQCNKYFLCNVGKYKHFIWVGAKDIDVDNVVVKQTPIGFYDSDKTDSGDEMEGAVCLETLKDRQERKKFRQMRKKIEETNLKYKNERMRKMLELDEKYTKTMTTLVNNEKRIDVLVHETDITEDPSSYAA